MSNETKRDVFDKLLNEYVADELLIDGLVYEPDQHIGEPDREYFAACYSAALPDDLPVIPKAVGKYIRWCKGEGGIGNVSDAMNYTYGDVAAWLYNERNSDTFASAWLLGVWRVAETGEIVKLEAKE